MTDSSSESGFDLDLAVSAISDPTRRRILEELAKSPRRTNELAELAGVSVPALSRHLRLLREQGIVGRTDVEGDGRGRRYQVEPQAMQALTSWLTKNRWAQALSANPTETAENGAPATISRAERKTYLRRVGGFLDGFATSDTAFFERHLAEDVLLYFPGSATPFDKPSTVASVTDHPPYVQWNIDDAQFRRIGLKQMLVVITVAVRTTANTEPVRVVQSMIFEDHTEAAGDENAWVLQFLQQTPVSNE